MVLIISAQLGCLLHSHHGPRPLRLLTVVSAGQVGAALHADGELGGAGLGAQAGQQREADRGRTLLQGYILRF